MGTATGSLQNWNTIVVATDLTGTSEAAVALGRQLATAFQSKVVLAHGLDPAAYANFQGAPRPIAADLSAEAQAALDKLSRQFLSEGIPSNSVVRQETVTRLLLDIIRQHKAGLVILGTRGASGAGPLLVGTVAEELVRQSPCPVLAVAADTLVEGRVNLTGGQILVPVENNPASIAAISTARALAEKFGLGLLLLHARTASEAAAHLNPCAGTVNQIQFPQGSTRVPVRCLVKDGQPAEVIQQVAAEYPVSMIVLGVNRESRSGGIEADRLHYGTAFSVLAAARVPVLCVPPSGLEKESVLASALTREADEPCSCK
jgi:nucleotide-binding universal stress UspA family protein